MVHLRDLNLLGVHPGHSRPLRRGDLGLRRLRTVVRRFFGLIGGLCGRIWLSVAALRLGLGFAGEKRMHFEEMQMRSLVYAAGLSGHLPLRAVLLFGLVIPKQSFGFGLFTI